MITSGEGPSVEYFNLDHAIKTWYSKKCHELEVRYHIIKYLAKTAATNSETIDFTGVTLFDLKTTQTMMISRLQFPILC